MAINVGTANTQAQQIEDYARQLRSARSQMVNYRSSLQGSWQGEEMSYIVQGIDTAIAKIDALLNELTALGRDIRSAAAAIDREEKAAAAAAAAEAARQERVNAARAQYNQSIEELDKIAKQRAEIVQQMRNTKSNATLANLNKKLSEIDKQMAAAKENCDACKAAMNAAGR